MPTWQNNHTETILLVVTQAAELLPSQFFIFFSLKLMRSQLKGMASHSETAHAIFQITRTNATVLLPGNSTSELREGTTFILSP